MPVGRADLHLHTRVSDGMGTVEQVLLRAVERGLDVIAVTDHEDATGGQRAREAAARMGLKLEVVVGAEVTTAQGHVLALFIEEAPRSFRSVEATLEAIHAQGGLAVVPHPMSWLTRSVSERTLERIMQRGEAGVTFDAIELANPSPAGLLTRRKAVTGNAGWGLAATGSSDAHHLVHVGTGWTEFEGETAEALRTALEEKRTTGKMTHYAGMREVGLTQVALQLAWGYAATPRKMLRWRSRAGGR